MSPKVRNNVQQLREAQLLSKAELARRAGISSLTIDRIEAGKDCRLDTKRKIILGLGLTLSQRQRVFAVRRGKTPGR
jgi:DNA-binding XRE family transcriptional regulator